MKANGPFINDYQNPSRKLSEVEDNTGTIAICDARYFEIWRLEQVDAWFNAGYGPAYDSDSPSMKYKDSGHIAKRHNSGFNATFCDGHAQFIKNSTLGQWTSRRGD